MTDRRCPNEVELLQFVDDDLPPEQRARIEAHLRHCGHCAQQVEALGSLIEDIAAPPESAPFDVAEHVADVMARLDSPAKSERGSRWALWGGAFAAAAAVMLLVTLGTERPNASLDEFTARGSSSEGSFSRDLGVQLYARVAGHSLRPLGAGNQIPADVALTAGLRNLGGTRAHLLLFVVDAERVVHWIAPEFLEPDTDPESIPIDPSSSERLLPTAAAFDDLASGPLEVIAVLTREPMRVSHVESLSPDQLRGDLTQRFPRAEIRRFSLEVKARIAP